MRNSKCTFWERSNFETSESDFGVSKSSIWKYTTCETRAFFLPIFSRYFYDQFEVKFSQVYYFMHIMVRHTRWSLTITNSVQFKVHSRVCHEKLFAQGHCIWGVFCFCLFVFFFLGGGGGTIWSSFSHSSSVYTKLKQRKKDTFLFLYVQMSKIFESLYGIHLHLQLSWLADRLHQQLGGLRRKNKKLCLRREHLNFRNLKEFYLQ